MLPAKISFVDIETTGGRSLYDRIIEIGILRVENNILVETFHSLINPNAHLPKEIEMLTGITSGDLDDAPTFRHIKDDISNILEGTVFVAHNVRFDYGFLKSEFMRENITFKQKHFCTVRLSRLLYPEFRHHNLDAIIERFSFQCESRHRALDDAKVLFDFYKRVQTEFPEKLLTETISKTMKKPSVPLKVPYSVLENLPETPGVYIFYAESGMPLYIGKSINIRDRVLSHFSNDIRSGTEMNISRQITQIETVQTAGELGALLLEQKMIKKYLPLYNKKSRIKQELIAIKSRINKDGFKEAYIEPITNAIFAPDPYIQNDFLGFYKSKKQAKAYLTDIAKTYNLCEKLLSLEKTPGACFAYRLDKCNGGCVKEEKSLIYNLRFDVAFQNSKILPWPYGGSIVIEEHGVKGKKEYFIIDEWRYIGNITIDDENNRKEELIKDVVFDLDTYKILRQFIKNPANRKKIKILRKDERNMLQQFRDY
jgi:DNA polymerase-3 subunit epsilon